MIEKNLPKKSDFVRLNLYLYHVYKSIFSVGLHKRFQITLFVGDKFAVWQMDSNINAVIKLLRQTKE